MKPVLLSMEAEFLSQIDEARGDVPRTVWIRRACEKALTGPSIAEAAVVVAQQHAKIHAAERAERQAVITKGHHPDDAPGQIWPKEPKPKPFKSRLKGEWKAP